MDNAEDIRRSGLDIYLEVGDEDLLNLQDGAEFLHRILWDQDIPHEYHQVRWADHGGPSVNERLAEALCFLHASFTGSRKQRRNVDLNEAERAFVEYVQSGGPAAGKPVPQGASQGTPDTALTIMTKLWEPLRALAVSRDADMQRNYGHIPNTDS